MINRQRTRQYLQSFRFEDLFIEELGWEQYGAQLSVLVEGESTICKAVAQKRGLVVFVYWGDGEIPLATIRNQLERQVAQSYREHILIFVNGARTEQKWLWVRREIGKPLARRTIDYVSKQHSGEILLQKLETIAFSLAEEEKLALVDVTSRVRAAFDVERATKKFYDQFKQERNAFEKFVQGIADVEMSRWYVSVMLNRLMFVYFIQRKGFLDGDREYLRNRMRLMQARYGGDQFYSFYRYFLLRLFHEGLGEPDHDPELEALIGKVPYLNGGIFQLHEVEEKYPDIQISDDAFGRIFDFFDQYQWHLDDRPLQDDREINPDVLGYIFEKYINQKQMGAYYTKEDITEYISKNTIIPFLFDEAQKECAIAFAGGQSVWRLAQADPDRYLHAAMRHGTEQPLPLEIAVGLQDVSQRGVWNTPTPEAYGLPTEIWRETVARRQRVEEVKGKLVAGDVTQINDFITYNLDIQQLAQDVIENSEGPELLRAFWKGINRVSVLDPTCGSGAFLFAALNILQPLYEACLERMAGFVGELGPDDHPQKYSDFKRVLAQVAQHPNQTYFVLKSIVVNNLYGVDIMAEAVEIAKLRLFLKLVSQVETVSQVEPLPDIDFNIRAGNTLVGFTTREEVRQAIQAKQVGSGIQQGKLLFGEDEAALTRIEEKAGDVDRLFSHFRAMQTSGELNAFDAADFVTTKQQLQARLRELEGELNQYLAQQYGVNLKNQQAFEKWQTSHQPFHWFIEFYGILKQGGFDVIIGNPPYVQYNKIQKQYRIRDYVTEDGGNLYIFVLERTSKLIQLQFGHLGMIVPIALISIAGTVSIRRVLFENFQAAWMSNFAIRPAKLFEGVEQRLTIYLASSREIAVKKLHLTKYLQWYKAERSTLFQRLEYCDVRGVSSPEFVPKVNDQVSLSIIRKITNTHKELVEQYLSNKHSGFTLYFHRTPGYWIRIMDFEPYFRSPTSTRSIHHIRELHVSHDSIGKFIGAFISSSLYFFYFFATGNCRNLTSGDVKALSIGRPTKEILTQSEKLFDKLMESYQQNSVIKSRGVTEFQEFNWSLSKPIVDEIDRLMAKHFSLSEAELDLIISYDIKIRMSNELFDDDEGDEA